MDRDIPPIERLFSPPAVCQNHRLPLASLPSMESVFGWIFTVVKVLLLFGAAIFVHEFGHYWVARRRGMRVDGFSIGFGPKIFAWMQDGVEWSVRWIPAGGFVKLPQMITSEAIEGKADQAVPPASPFSRILVAAAGPFMNVVFAFLIATFIWVIGLPVLVNPPIIGRVEPGSSEYAAGIRERDRILAVSGASVRSWQDINLEVLTSRTNRLLLTLGRADQRFTALVGTRTNEQLHLRWLDLEPFERPVVGLVEADKPAGKIGLKPGDKLLSFDGVFVLNQEHLVELVSKGQGRSCELISERDSVRITNTVTPIYDPALKRGRIGIAFAGGHYEIQRPGPTPFEQIDEVLHMMSKTFLALWHHKETGVGAKDMSGPVGILGKLAVDVRTDFRLALKFMVMLNINLAILNLLPLPVLDGGHIMMSLYELLTRRRVSVRFQEYATTGFAILLISFMAYVTFFDINRFWLFKMMWKQQSVIHPASESAAPSVSTNRMPAP